MIDRFTRTIKDRLLLPLVDAIPQRVTPDMITVVSIVPGVAAALFGSLGLWGWGLGAFVLNRILDGLDGLLARRRVSQSDFGGYLDIMIDFLVYAVVPVGVEIGAGSIDGIPEWSRFATAMPLAILLGSFYINAASWMYLSAVLEKRRTADREPGATSVTMPPGLVEGTETIGFYILFFLLPRWSRILFLVMAAGTLIGAAQRLVWARRTLG
ncbi:MAG: CDP-alcohol phosphatidyltransferase family protein [Alkalispirochaeta sp.]